MITLLLPGMDGTGIQFAALRDALPQALGPLAVSFPVGQPLDYDELTDLVAGFIPVEGPWAMVAESFSGPLAIRLAARHPERLRGLVLASSFAECPVRWVKWAGFLAGPVTGLRRIAPSFLLKFWIAGDDAAESMLAVARTATNSVSPAVMAQRLRSVLIVDDSAMLRDLQTPLLILAASRDRLVGPRAIRRLRSLRPDARCVTLDAPHMILQCRPAECAAEITRFLAEKRE